MIGSPHHWWSKRLVEALGATTKIPTLATPRHHNMSQIEGGVILGSDFVGIHQWRTKRRRNASPNVVGT